MAEPAPPHPPLQLGDLTVDLVSDGTFRLDGGAMFGVVPRPLWSRRKTPDERNRVTLGTQCLLIRGGAETILVDTGMGGKWSDKLLDIYAIERPHGGLVADLARLGVTPAEVDVVLLTHLHFDHAGGATVRDPDGSVRPTFPNARYLVQRGNLDEEARAFSELRKASYLEENYGPIEALGRLERIDGDVEVAPGVRVEVTGGHQRFHQAVWVEGGGTTLIYPADVVPTAAHLDPPWIMAYDHFPLETLARKKAFLERALSGDDVIFVLEHEADLPIGRVAKDGRRYLWEPIRAPQSNQAAKDDL